MKKFMISLLIVITIGIGAGGFFVFQNIQKPFLKNEDIVLEVKEGDSISSIIAKMNSDGQLRNQLITKVYFKLKGKNISLAKGTYIIKSQDGLNEFIEILSKGPSEDNITVTIPEGFNIEKIGAELEKNGLVTQEEFIEAAKSYELPEYIPDNKDKRYNIEGYLYPDTYSFSKDMSATDIIRIMIKQFNNVIEDIERKNDIVIKRENLDKIITKASMIENEAASDKERKIVASVIENRLAADMKLKIDAAVTYGVGKHLEVVLNKHTEEDTPYNTYTRKGLPVGAISSPGRNSIEAALDPDRTDYKFYLLIPGKKEHYFTNSDVDFMQKRKEYGYDKI